MQPQEISREFVKPSPPSNHPKIHNLSFFDQMVYLRYYMSLLFFYTCKNRQTTAHNHTNSVLKTSLSAALSHYYPLAGRHNNDLTIDCNDEGALFVQSKPECSLSEFLKNPDLELLKPLFPDNLPYIFSPNTIPLVVQVTYFQCGGMSIGICITHKILDMRGMSTFIKEWSSLARHPEKEIHPEFNIASFYPPLDLPIQQEKLEPPSERKDCVYRRVVFDGSKIAKLKEMVADQVPNPTRVEVVISLLYKSAIFANAKATSSDSLVPSFMGHPMSLHTKISPPLSERSRGNIWGVFYVVPGMNKREVELGYLVKEFRNAKTELSNSCANDKKKDISQLVLRSTKCSSVYANERQHYNCSSWCRFAFYESNFGWGKPLWVTTTLFKAANSISFMDTREGDGIEAYICLEEKAMAIFENDQELLSFCCFNPSIIDPVWHCVSRL